MTKPSSSLSNIPISKPLVVNSKGLIVPLGEPVGVGGEGRVFEVLNEPDLIAKIYHKRPLEEDHVAKLRAMLAINASEIASIAAWPRDVLIDTRRKSPVGLLMARVTNAHELHELYGATPRAKYFPHAHWHHLILAARNTAAAFDAVHSRGVVVGDVNQGNLLVDAEMCVRFIDCDSFQITTNRRVFNCPVGTPHFTPPELQSQRLSEVKRTPQHDAFGLALLIFHLLFVGRHPFAGRYRGQGDMHIEQAIGERRFAFSRHSDETQVDPPPCSLTLDDVSPHVAQMFENAFRLDPRSDGKRPTPRDWVVALEDMLRRRKECQFDPSHVYFSQARECPWCRIEASGGPAFFVNEALVGGSMQSRLAAYERCLKSIGDIYFPDLARKSLELPPMPVIKKTKDRPPLLSPDWFAITAGVGAVLCLAGVFFWPLIAAGAVLTVAGGLGLLLGKFSKLRRGGNERYEKEIERMAVKVLTRAQEVYAAHQAREAEFDTFAAVVNAGRERFTSDTDNMEVVVQQLRAEQKEDYLRGFELRQYRRRIKGLTRADVAVLLSYGIETALECESHLLAGIPSIPQETVIELLNFREQKAAEFAYQPEAGITERELEIDRQEAAARFKISLARKVLSGATRMKSMAHQGKLALDRDMRSFEDLTEQYREVGREFQDFQATRNPLERLINQHVAGPIAAMIAPPVVGAVLWLIFG